MPVIIQMSEHSIKRTDRCQAMTLRRNANTRCKHMTQRGIYCHQHEKALKHFRIKEHDGDLALFTTEPIPAGETICLYTGQLVQDDAEANNPYAVQVKRRPATYLDASHTNEPGEGRWAHHHGQPNAKFIFEQERSRGRLDALRDIEAGEEIIFSAPVLKPRMKIISRPNLEEEPIPKKKERKPTKKKAPVKRGPLSYEQKKERSAAKFERDIEDEIDVIRTLRKSEDVAKKVKGVPKIIPVFKRVDANEDVWQEKLLKELVKRRKELVAYLHMPENKVQELIDNMMRKRKQ